MGTAKSKVKSFSLQNLVTKWERNTRTRYQYLVPEITTYTINYKKTFEKFTSSNMVRKIFRLKCGHNLHPGYKLKFDPTENMNYAKCWIKYDKFHLLINGKKLELYDTNLKVMVNDTLQMHCDKPVTMNMEFLLGENILPEEAALTVRELPTEFHNQGIQEENFRCHGSTFDTWNRFRGH